MEYDAGDDDLILLIVAHCQSSGEGDREVGLFVCGREG